MTYEHLLLGNERFGTTPKAICHNVFNCDPEQIHERVVIAPWWKPDIFLDFSAHIDTVFDSEHRKIWNIRLNEFSFTYIRAGIGAPIVGDVTLTLGCTPCSHEVRA